MTSFHSCYLEYTALMFSAPHTGPATANDALSRMLEQARSLGATGADAVLFSTVDTSTSFRLGKPEGIERAESRAVGLRVFVGAQQAIVSGTDTHQSALKELAERATAMAKATPADPDSCLAPESLLSDASAGLDLCDFNEPDAAWLSAQCREAEDAAMAVDGVTNSEGADAGYSRSAICLAIHNGKSLTFAHEYHSSHFSLSASVLAGTGTGMERDYDYSSTRFRSDLKSAQSIGKSAGERAVRRLNPRKVATCNVPVVFDPRASRSLLSALAGAISGSSIARGSSFLKNDLNTQIFSRGIRIIDDPHMPRGLGSRPFDGEGVKNMRRAIVEDGVLATWLLDMRTAGKLRMHTTGHAARGVASPPSPSSTNLYMDKGALTPAQLIADIRSGLYLTETFGMGINTTTGDYSQGAAGFWIENGEIAYPVSEITIAGHLRDMFKAATPANDLEFRYATNAPTLRIDSMTVAGT
jgi:PmbA protein